MGSSGYTTWPFFFLLHFKIRFRADEIVFFCFDLEIGFRLLKLVFFGRGGLEGKLTVDNIAKKTKVDSNIRLGMFKSKLFSIQT